MIIDVKSELKARLDDWAALADAKGIGNLRDLGGFVVIEKQLSKRVGASGLLHPLMHRLRKVGQVGVVVVIHQNPASSLLTVIAGGCAGASKCAGVGLSH